MFQIDRRTNRLRRLERTSFANVGLHERQHLQEWLAAMPEALGEELGDLLIIQKEFDGFEGTRERLDLLALDRAGRLVVIENKLDDSGRNVVWQALKYAAYCSSLTTSEIVAVYAHYLRQQNRGDDAASAICAFLGEVSLEDVVLNEGSSQRIILIAAHFRREVTAAVLWLRQHQIDAQCMKVVPYRFQDELFVDLQQVIPPPEAADYMIRVAEKDSLEKAAKGTLQLLHEERLGFWAELLPALWGAGFERWKDIEPTKDSWLPCPTGVSGCSINLVFMRNEIRVELVLNRPDARENKQMYDQLHLRKEELETSLGQELDWRRADDKRASLVVCRTPVQGNSRENWPEMIAWLVEHYGRMEKAFTTPRQRLGG